jgi:hypothetical protein
MNNLATQVSFRVLVAQTMIVSKVSKLQEKWEPLVFIHIEVTAVTQAVPTITDRFLIARPNELQDCVLKQSSSVFPSL